MRICIACKAEKEFFSCCFCGGKGSYHDCMDDCCVCLDPDEPTHSCDTCDGVGTWLLCPNCDQEDIDG